MKTTKKPIKPSIDRYIYSLDSATKACRDAQNTLRRFQDQMPTELHLELYCLTVSLQEAMCDAWSKLEDERLKFHAKQLIAA